MVLRTGITKTGTFQPTSLILIAPQKPMVENTIGLLRRWFYKKGTDWSKVTEKELQEAISVLNNKYRKSLNYKSAMEVALAHDIIKIPSNKKSCN